MMKEPELTITEIENGQTIFNNFLMQKLEPRNQLSLFPNFTQDLSRILMDNKAIIAGGAVLAALMDSRLNDLDIYVNIQNSQKLIHDLINVIGIHEHSQGPITPGHFTPPYDESFLIKNNILGRLKLVLPFTNQATLWLSRRNPGVVMIDVMIVNDNVSVQNVVSNFDLTFCMVWYGGRDAKDSGIPAVYAFYPEDISTKKGRLTEDYYTSYTNGNRFTLKRLQKYNKRGFTITIPIPVLTVLELKGQPPKKVITPEQWVVYKIIDILMTGFGNDLNYIQFFIVVNDVKVSMLIYVLQLLKQNQIGDSIYSLAGLKKLLEILYRQLIEHFNSVEQQNFLPFQYNLSINKVITFILTVNPDYLLLEYASNIKSSLCNFLMLSTGNYAQYMKDVLDSEIYDAISCDKRASIIPDHDNIPLDADELLVVSSVVKLLSFRTKYAHYIINKQLQDYYTDLIPQFPPILPPTGVLPDHAERVAVLIAQNRASARAAAEAAAPQVVEEVHTDFFDADGIRVDPRCFSELLAGETNTLDWFKDNDNILLVMDHGISENNTIVCTSIRDFRNILENETRIVYECRPGELVYLPDDGTNDGALHRIEDVEGNFNVRMSDVILDVAYVPFSYGLGGTTVINGYLRESTVRDMVEQALDPDPPALGGRRVFRIVFEDTITHTIDKRTFRIIDYNDISTNHCQAGSAILLFRAPAIEGVAPAPQSPLTTVDEGIVISEVES